MKASRQQCVIGTPCKPADGTRYGSYGPEAWAEDEILKAISHRQNLHQRAIEPILSFLSAMSISQIKYIGPVDDARVFPFDVEAPAFPAEFQLDDMRGEFRLEYKSTEKVGNSSMRIVNLI